MKLLTCPPRRPISAAALAVGLALALAPAAASAATASPQAPAAKAPAPHLVGCNESGRVRPTRFNPICNDGAYTVVGLHWSAWSDSAARGAGEFYTRSCVPTCAKGTVKLYPVNVSAWRVRSGDYTRFSYSFTRGVPSGFSRSWTIDDNGGRWSGRVV
jgi:opacity protein-like surface antigen